MRVAHKQGEVYVTWSDGTDQAHARLTPEDAVVHASNIVQHAALARLQKEKAAEEAKEVTVTERTFIDLLDDIDGLEEQDEE